jgi:rRNA maturation endonuclease Nob1
MENMMSKVKINKKTAIWVWSCVTCENTDFHNELDFEIMTYIDICLECGQRYAWSKEKRGDK